VIAGVTLGGVVQVSTGGRGAGAGFIYISDGLVMIDHHVVGTCDDPMVLLTDGRAFDAELVRRSRRLDLVMLHLPMENLSALPIGDSDSLRVGELIFAVGHVWGRVGVAISVLCPDSARSEASVEEDGLCRPTPTSRLATPTGRSSTSRAGS
jgi:serine protease Do